ncbi:MAG: hypothetical protein ACI90A_000620 [Shewanella sp.]|jgi:hypothetical protein
MRAFNIVEMNNAKGLLMHPDPIADYLAYVCVGINQ